MSNTKGDGKGGGGGRGGGKLWVKNPSAERGEDRRTGGDGFRRQHEKKEVYSEHVTDSEAHAGLESGKYFQGKLRVNPKSTKNAYVAVKGVSRDVLIQDEIGLDRKATGYRNRAIHGDVVVLEMLPEAEWPVLTSRGAAADISEATLQDFVSDDMLARLQLSRDGPDADGEDAAAAKSRQETVTRLWRPNEAVVQEFKREEDEVHWIDEAARRDPGAPKQPVGKVVGILRASHVKTLVGALEVKDASTILRRGAPLPDNVTYVFFKPHEPVYPKLIVPRLQLPEAFVAAPLELMGRIFRVNISDDWPTTSKMATGESLRALGEVANIADETEALLVEYGCNHGLFTEEQLAPLRALLRDDAIDSLSSSAHWRIPDEELARRRDLRSYRIFTIDPSNAKDLDDALHITPMEDGSFEVGVHIADVSYFLEEGTPLDSEAAARATSVYLVQKVVPMLPPILCEQLCSLNPNVDRLAFSVIFRLEGDGTLSERHRPWFGRTVIRSCAKLDYATAQRMVDGEIPNTPRPSSADPQSGPDGFLRDLPETVWQTSRHPVGHEAWRCAQDVCTMHRLAMSRRQVRKDAGALSLHGTKLAFKLDGDGNPSSCEPYPIKESNQLVEEYMLLANTLVAERLLVGVGRHAFVRGHPRPLADGLREVEAFARARGLPFDSSDQFSIQASLNAITQQADTLTLQAITALLMVPMKPAVYMTAGSQSSSAWHHYALNIPYYTHFTSPIRRYADVCVHRLLARIVAAAPTAPTAPTSTAAPPQERLELGDELFERQTLAADHCNFMKESSMKAQRRSDVVFLAVHISDSPRRARAVVISLGDKSFTVYIPQFGVQERLMVDEMPGVTSELSDVDGKKSLRLRRTLVDPDTRRPAEAVNNSRGIPNALEFTSELVIGIMTEITVQLSAKMSPPPVDVRVALVGPL